MSTRFEVTITDCAGEDQWERKTHLSGDIGEPWWEASEDIVRLLNGAFIAAYGYRPPVEFTVRDLEGDEA